MKEDKSCCLLIEDDDYKISSCTDGERDASYDDAKEEPLIENNYENIVNNMTIEDLANRNVSLANVNNMQLFWVTSTGQLFPYNNYHDAIAYEIEWLNSPCIK